MVFTISVPTISVIFVSLIVMKNFVMVVSRCCRTPISRIMLFVTLFVCAMVLSLLTHPSCIPSLRWMLFLPLSSMVWMLSILVIIRRMFHVKQFLKIIKALPVILARIAHVIEHIFCDDVPHISLDDEEDDL